MIEAYAGKNETFATALLKPDGTPQDLTGGTVHFMAKRNLADADASAVIAKQAVIINAVLGTIEVRLVAADTAALVAADFTTLYYDIQAKDGTGAVQVTERGMLYVYGPVRQVNP